MILFPAELTRPFRFIDLFAGIGGFHLAAAAAGGTCVFASEWDKHAAKVYEKNFGVLPKGDITQIEAAEIPPHDWLCGGFPCQAFSISGKQRGFEDARGTLFFDIARLVDAHQPKVLFLENVKNFAQHDHGRTLETVLHILSNLGYNVFHKVLNASNFGLPQKRERIYFVAFRKDLNVTHFLFPKPINRLVALESLLLPDEATHHFRIERSDVQLDQAALQRIERLPHLPQKAVRLGIVNKGGQGERIYHPKGHAITLSAYGGGIGAKTGLYWVNGAVRKLAPRECARVQGFPDHFQLDDQPHQAYKQFGNSVPIDVLQYIIVEILKTMGQF